MHACMWLKLLQQLTYSLVIINLHCSVVRNCFYGSAALRAGDEL